MSVFYSEFSCPDSPDYTLVVEDDGRVAYGYLLHENTIIGDVWLYNQHASPANTDWQDVENMPFLNPEKDVKENIPAILAINQVEVIWSLSASELSKAEIFIRGRLVAIISPGAKPGWSALVKADNPLARVLK